MKRSSVLGVIGATAVLIGAGPSIAFAATGTFTYQTPEGANLTLTDPPSETCIDLEDVGIVADNGTDSAVTLFQGPGCGFDVAVVEPGERLADVGPFASVRFVE